MRKKVTKSRNHFDEFVKFIDSKRDVLSVQFRTELIDKLNFAMLDAFNRGMLETVRSKKR